MFQHLNNSNVNGFEVNRLKRIDKSVVAVGQDNAVFNSADFGVGCGKLYFKHLFITVFGVENVLNTRKNRKFSHALNIVVGKKDNAVALALGFARYYTVVVGKLHKSVEILFLFKRVAKCEFHTLLCAFYHI